MADAPVGPLSGGEKSRLALALIVHRRPNLLLLDEPTNHLDLEMRHALTRALAGFEGSLVLVSHDRALLRTICDSLVLVADGASTAVRRRRRRLSRLARAPARSCRRRERPEVPDARELRRAQRDAASAARRALLARRRPLLAEAAKLEAVMTDLQRDKQALDARLADPATYAAGRGDEIQSATRRAAELAAPVLPRSRSAGSPSRPSSRRSARPEGSQTIERQQRVPRTRRVASAVPLRRLSRCRSQRPMAVRIPCRIRVGLGGHPGTAASTGSTFETRPRLAWLSPKMPPVQPQSPIATTSFGSGIAS